MMANQWLEEMEQKFGKPSDVAIPAQKDAPVRGKVLSNVQSNAGKDRRTGHASRQDSDGPAGPDTLAMNWLRP